jgi:anti-sigma factor RsiW
MDCNETKWLLDPYIDGELELTRQLDVGAHLASCSTCKKAVEPVIKFRNSVRINMPVYKAPPELKATIRAVLRKVSKSETERISDLRRFLLYAAAVLVFCLLCISAWMATFHGNDRELIAQAISNHSRSLLADHLLDVTASDQHVVKSWFSGKLDYSPPVADLAESGYKLVGGRLDILENRPVAAIVYRHQEHFINEFAWPSASRAIDFDVQSHQGCSLCGWNRSGFNYLIVSELRQADMEKFEDQLRDWTEKFAVAREGEVFASQSNRHRTP